MKKSRESFFTFNGKRLLLLGLGLCVAFFGIAAWRTNAQKKEKRAVNPPPGSQRRGGETVTPTSLQPVSVSTVNFGQMATRALTRRNARNTQSASSESNIVIHPPGTIDESTGASEPTSQTGISGTLLPGDVEAPLGPSPAPASQFLAQEDGPRIGTTSFSIPPDTQGAVGLDKVFVNTNTNYRIQDKTTGAALSTVSSDTFWASSGGSGFFDPRITYDQYNNRWILAEDSNAMTANSSIEIAVSRTSDPQGTYDIYRFVVGSAVSATPPAGQHACGEWADFPMLGFNKNWLAVSMNMFQIQTSGTSGTTTCNGGFVEGKILVVDYPQARAGTAASTLFANSSIGFSMHPVDTYSSSEATLYLVQHLSSASATYNINTLTGTPSAPLLTLGGALTRPGGGWTQGQGENLSQQCIAGTPTLTHICPATVRRIDTGDSQIRSTPMFRNGNIWYSQTIILPAGTVTTSSRVGVQWTRINTTGAFVDGGRVEDPTATLINGGKLYAYSSLAVNANNDMLLGFSQFGSSQFASSGYSLRLGTDPAGTQGDPFIYKAGEDYYEKTFGSSRNRWGDYSGTHVDPVNDRDMWTVQEYAGTRIPPGTGTNDSRWGTWWAKVAAPATTAAGVSVSGRVLTSGGRGLSRATVTISDNRDGQTRVMATGSRGYYRFDDVQAGRGYLISVGSRRFTYTPRFIEVTDNVADFDFTPDR